MQLGVCLLQCLGNTFYSTVRYIVNEDEIMSDAMQQKRELIQQMLEMQRKFIDYEHQHGVMPHEYFAPESGHPLEGFRQEYADISNKIIDLAHTVKGSKR